MMTERDYYKGVEHLLYSLPFLRAYAKSKEEELSCMEHDNLQGMSYDGVSTSQTFCIKRETEDTALGNLARIEGIKNDIKRVRSKIDAIERSLDLLDDTQREIIECKYLLKMPLDTISDRVHKSKNQVMRDNKTAIRNMQISFFGPQAIDKESPLNHIWP